MDKSSSVLAALDAGKLPTTQQANQLIDWLKDVGIARLEPSQSLELSTQGQILADDLRGVLDAYKQLGKDKNSDNILQQAIWHLTEGDLTVTAEVEEEVDQTKEDVKAMRAALKNLISVVWTNVSMEGTSIIQELLSILRLSLADAAEALEGKAGAAKDTLRSVEKGVQEGERDTLGRSKQRLEEEKDPKVAWQHGMDTVKGAGTSVIGATQAASASLQETAEKTTSRLEDALNKMSDRAQTDPQYREALDTLFSIFQKRLNQAMETASDPNTTLSKFIVDPTPEQHIPKALRLLRTLVERLANNTSLEGVIAALRTCVFSIVKNPELKEWVDDSIRWARKVLAEPGYARSEEAQKTRKALEERWKSALEKDWKWHGHVKKLKEELYKIELGLQEDKDLQRVVDAQAKLGEDLASGLTRADEEVESGLKAAVDQATWFWQDLFKIYIPNLLSKMKDVPIPRTEYKDPEIEFVLENLDISSFNLLPSHVYIRNITDVDIQTSAAAASHTKVGTLTHVHIEALQLKLHDVSFWYKDKNSTLGPSELTGLLALQLPAKGVEVDIKVRLIPSTVTGKESRTAKKHFHVVENVAVKISEDVNISVKESNHAVLMTLFKPIMVMRLREALEKTMTEQLKGMVEWVDGIAFDVSQRREVFEDAGLGGGSSLVAALWSELGRLQRENEDELGLRATGTGVVLEHWHEGEGEEAKAQFAMGAEPQILSGEKRGPLGTGSTSVKEQLRATGEEMEVDIGEFEADTGRRVRAAGKEVLGEVKGAVREGKRQLSSFRRSVHHKSKHEKKKTGWESTAFDV
ncbi:uncharacterized protein LACBIDRAFT_317829 [Laccaria bicolor S238N-H82]|uniref:Predicted protein n=1 Tax=Laccaria bicolor (strain S238N-H82 / ATCC MYA-4686) TaxID=486041 RepID=B0D5B9_LACBS|nr:uncharacterized protein LACBIDRAFT_317829 [Laccaria bicolor S238N-H82]EDR09989.1 predicted protein [Laccaria bicolor S238N-H82]|eukprot:XP_001879374.1 predicted protein [Laccaria bicolor S238N-H82]